MTLADDVIVYRTAHGAGSGKNDETVGTIRAKETNYALRM
jgi:hypothetical protein